MNSSPSSQDPSASSAPSAPSAPSSPASPASPAPASSPAPSAPAPDPSAPPHYHHVHMRGEQLRNAIISIFEGGGVSALLYALPGLLGFTTGGITGGSIAAWMMSLGGGTTPWVVSVLQSIGAVGFGLGGIIAILGIGGFVSLVTFLARNNKHCAC